MSDYIRENFFITSSGMLNPALLQHALTVTTADRLIFSTDYPFQQPTADEIGSFLGNFSTTEERAAFASGTAAGLFGINLGK